MAYSSAVVDEQNALSFQDSDMLSSGHHMPKPAISMLGFDEPSVYIFIVFKEREEIYLRKRESAFWGFSIDSFFWKFVGSRMGMF